MTEFQPREGPRRPFQRVDDVLGAGRPVDDATSSSASAVSSGSLVASDTTGTAVVIGDAEFLDRPDLHRHPTIAIGGPGVNVVSQRLVDDLPMRWQHKDRAFLQADLDNTNRVALWGMDAASTAQAVAAFLSEGYLDALLDRIWRFRPGSLM